ncbi:MAG: tRNA (adenosine(37)-N6)-dimethylallyltransferase MiaA [Peptococcaceae bacterium]|nr:tRNA (adenosine(37)-N6)-dimethylallyltransferase MiaA [Peptococcaceae bacterium]
MKPRVLAIVGPTAVGKSELTLHLAARLDGEIISADSMQVYRGMDIGTAKPSPAERCLRPHHLIDVVEPGATFSAADYQLLARAAVRDILGRGKLPIFSGGTGLYLRAAIDDYNFTATESNDLVRNKLHQEVREAGLAALYTRLRHVDAKVAMRLDPNDQRRILRALEVFETTGRPLSAWESEKDIRSSIYDVILIGLIRPRDELYSRIDERVEQMITSGLLEETRRLYEGGLSFVAGQALGYKELQAHLEGQSTLEEAKERLKRQTRRFAKRQLTWFRADPRIQWVDAGDLRQAEGTILEILAKEWGMHYN